MSIGRVVCQMARPVRVEFPGAVYHLTSRGNAKADIFLDDADRRIFLQFLGKTVRRFGWQLYAYCLMGNHYHLLAETPQPNLSRGMHQLNGLYTQSFNRRHGRVGHVLQGRFDSRLVERDSYLLELGRYIALNPVRAGFVAGAADWPWSSFRSSAGVEPQPPWLQLSPLLSMLHHDRAMAMQRYVEFVALGIGAPSPWEALKGQVILGSETFAERLRPALKQHAQHQDKPRAQRFAARPALDRLLPAGLTKIQRNAAMAEAFHRHGYTLSQIAAHVGLHYASISRIVQRADVEIQDLTPALQGG